MTSLVLTADHERIRRRVHQRLLDETDRLPDPVSVRASVVSLLGDEAPFLPTVERAEITEALLRDVLGLGPIELLLADEDITDVLVNGPAHTFVERCGLLEPVDLGLDADTIERVAQRIVAPLGLRLDRAQPMVDARLPDGSRLHAVLPPLAPDGPYLSIRRFAAREVALASFGVEGDVERFLASAVRDGRNIVVAGATGAGKTTLLNTLASFIPAGERVITIEETTELKFTRDHVVRLEARPANSEGAGRVTVRDLVRASLRMRPDRIVVGEVRGGESLDMLQAMNTGHDGSMSTVHANGPGDAMVRLETLVLFADAGLPLLAIRRQLAAAIDLVVFVARRAGSRRVESIVEVDPSTPDDAPIRVQELAGWDRTSLTLVGRPARPARRTGART